MAAFKQHCAFGFWRGKQIVDAGKDGEAMGQFGRITALTGLPSARELKALVKMAASLIDAGTKPPRAPKTGDNKPAPVTPLALAAAFKCNAAARRGYEALPPGKQREYAQWIAQAKRDDTRQRRIAQAVVWLAEGKSRNWKYENC